MPTFMNSMEIAEAQSMFKRDPILGPAAKFLSDYEELVGNVSDGWAYWIAGRRAADGLVTILGAAKQQYYRSEQGYKVPTRPQIEAACAKIAKFVETHKAFTSASIKPPVLFDPCGPISPAEQIQAKLFGVVREILPTEDLSHTAANAAAVELIANWRDAVKDDNKTYVDENLLSDVDDVIELLKEFKIAVRLKHGEGKTPLVV